MVHNKFQYLQSSARDFWHTFKTRKSYITIMFLLQVIGISLFSYIIITASIVLAEDLQNLTDPLAALDLENPNLSEQDILIQGAKMYSAYETLAENVTKYILMLMLVFFTFPGFIWSLAKMSVEGLNSKKDKTKSFIHLTKSWLLSFLSHYKSYLIITSVLFLPFSFITYLIGRVMLESDIVAFTNAAQVFTGILVLLAFLCLVTLSVATSSSWKIHLQKTKKLLSTKFLFLLLNNLLVAIPIAASIYFLHYATLISEDFKLMLLAAFLTVLSIIVAQLFLIISSKHLLIDGEKSD